MLRFGRKQEVFDIAGVKVDGQTGTATYEAGGKVGSEKMRARDICAGWLPEVMKNLVLSGWVKVLLEEYFHCLAGAFNNRWNSRDNRRN